MGEGPREGPRGAAVREGQRVAGSSDGLLYGVYSRQLLTSSAALVEAVCTEHPR